MSQWKQTAYCTTNNCRFFLFFVLNQQAFVVISILERTNEAARKEVNKKTVVWFLLPAGGGVLLVEALLSEDGRGPLRAQLYSLNMLVQTEGRERSAAQYAALLTAAGFSHVQHRFTGKIYDAVLARKDA